MATSLLREVTDPAVFVQEVAKQHDVFVDVITFGVLLSARASFWLDEIIRKFFECFNEDLPKPALYSPEWIEIFTNVSTVYFGKVHSPFNVGFTTFVIFS